MARYHLKLFVAGKNPKSDRISARVHELCRNALGQNYTLQVIDVIKRPDLAEQHQILATPTLLREKPLPRRLIVGDLSAIDAVMRALDLPNA